jgi:hypothetical protein
MTLTAGTEFVCNADIYLEVGYNSAAATLVAVGTSGSPIVFRGFDTTAGYWNGILVRSTALSSSKLDYVTIQNAGKLNNGAVELSKEIPVTHCTLSDGAGWGILYNAAFSTDYAATNTFSNFAQGDVGTL